jgi:hypothetical protein
MSCNQYLTHIRRWIKERRIVMTPLQKRAWLGLGIGAVLSAAILAVLIINGGTSFYDDDVMRWTVTGLMVGTVVSWAILLAPVLRGKGPAKALYDERDETVMRRASQVQLWGVIGSVAIWTVALTEVYWDEGAIPIVFAYLICWSILIVNTLAQAIGILIGYRRMG